MLNWSKRRYSKEQFSNAWKSSPSIRQVAITLGLVPTGDSYRVIGRAAEELGLTRQHLKGEKLKRTYIRMNLEDILVKDSTYTNATVLKRRLISEGLLKQHCYICGLTEWNKKPLPLIIDHIDGHKTNWKLQNLRLLCSNCDSQQPTYRGRNKEH